jgi:hypothetical protein
VSGGVPKGEQPRLAVVTLDPTTGAADLRVISEVVGDFPTIHPKKTGQPSRCAFVVAAGGSVAESWTGTGIRINPVLEARALGFSQSLKIWTKPTDSHPLKPPPTPQPPPANPNRHRHPQPPPTETDLPQPPPPSPTTPPKGTRTSPPW